MVFSSRRTECVQLSNHDRREQWQLVGHDREVHGTATWMFQSPLIRTRPARRSAGFVLLKLRRRGSAGLHDDLTIRACRGREIETR